MDKIFYNGKIKTLDQAYPECSAVAIKDGIILKLGTDEEVMKFATAETEKIDLKGKFMLPGFIDTHMHLLDYYKISSKLDLSETMTYEEARDLIAGRVAEAKASDSWIFGSNFNQDNWPVAVVPTRRDLDKITEEVPIFIRRSCGHISVMNTKGMEMIGFMDEKPTTDLYLGFYEDGTPNGIVKENTQNRVYESFGAPTLAEVKAQLVSAMADVAAKGITEIHTDDFEAFAGDYSELVMQAYTELAEEGKMPIRIYQQCLLRDKKKLERFIAEGHKTGEKHGHYTLGPLKLLGDGSLGAHTAAMRQDYANEPGNKGLMLYSQEYFDEICEIAHKNGLQIAVHCIGDATLEAVMNAYEKAMLKYPRADHRHGIVHCQIMDEKLQDRFKELNLVAYVQPVFLRYDMFVVDEAVGPELGKQSYNWRRYIDLGVHQSGGSDCPVEKFDVLPNICHAVTRSDGKGAPAWYPENGVTVDEAVRMFTVEGAYTSFEEAVKGTITIGKWADMVVLDKDIYEVPVDTIKDIRVLMTVVDGNIVYNA